jgi:hypothetical protein
VPWPQQILDNAEARRFTRASAIRVLEASLNAAVRNPEIGIVILRNATGHAHIDSVYMELGRDVGARDEEGGAVPREAGVGERHARRGGFHPAPATLDEFTSFSATGSPKDVQDAAAYHISKKNFGPGPITITINGPAELAGPGIQAGIKRTADQNPGPSDNQPSGRPRKLGRQKSPPRTSKATSTPAYRPKRPSLAPGDVVHSYKRPCANCLDESHVTAECRLPCVSCGSRDHISEGCPSRETMCWCSGRPFHQVGECKQVCEICPMIDKRNGVSAPLPHKIVQCEKICHHCLSTDHKTGDCDLGVPPERLCRKCLSREVEDFHWQSKCPYAFCPTPGCEKGLTMGTYKCESHREAPVAPSATYRRPCGNCRSKHHETAACGYSCVCQGVPFHQTADCPELCETCPELDRFHGRRTQESHRLTECRSVCHNCLEEGHKTPDCPKGTSDQRPCPKCKDHQIEAFHWQSKCVYCWCPVPDCENWFAVGQHKYGTHCHECGFDLTDKRVPAGFVHTCQFRKSWARNGEHRCNIRLTCLKRGHKVRMEGILPCREKAMEAAATRGGQQGDMGGWPNECPLCA